MVAAFHPELAFLQGTLADASRQTSQTSQTSPAPSGPFHVVAKAVGIGMPNAAVGTASRLAVLRPRAIVLIGTCGAYAGAGFAIGDVAIATKVKLVDPAACEGRAAIPAPMPVSLDGDATLAAALASTSGGRARAATVATTLAVTTDDALAARLARDSASHVEHLEAFAVATACSAFGVPFIAALGVANVVGTSAREQWRANHRATAEAAARVVLAWLESGAPGLASR